LISGAPPAAAIGLSKLLFIGAQLSVNLHIIAKLPHLTSDSRDAHSGRVRFLAS
jgi:hypothetical protein